MALDLSPLLINNALRPYHLSQAADLFTGETEDEFAEITNSTAIDDAKANIDNLVSAVAMPSQKEALKLELADLIDALEADWPFADFAAFQSRLATLKSNVNVVVDAGITFDAAALQSDIHDEVDACLVTETIFVSDVCDDANIKLAAAVAADSDNFPYMDAWCAGAGQYEKRRDAGADPTDTDLKHCGYCDGFGRVPQQQEIVMLPPTQVVYPD